MTTGRRRNAETLPAFHEDTYVPYKMRQFSAIIERRLQALESMAYEPSDDLEEGTLSDQYARVGHTHVPADIIGLDSYLTDLTGESIFNLGDVEPSPGGVNFGDTLVWDGSRFVTGTASGITASQILSLLLTVDGSGSGLDADLLDGQTGSYYRNVLNLTGILPPAQGGTGIGNYVLGDLLYASSDTALAQLAGNTTTNRRWLRQTGTGTVSAAPAWDAIAISDVTALQAALDGKVNDTGDTMTGNLRIVRSASAAALELVPSSGNQAQIIFELPGGGAFAMFDATAGQTRFTMSAAGVATFSGNLNASGATHQFNNVDSTGTFALGSTSAISREQRFRLTNSVVASGVDFVLDGAGTQWGLYDRTTTKWVLRITRGSPDTTDINGTLTNNNVNVRDGAILTSGTVADARLSANVALLNASNTWTSTQTVSNTVPWFSLLESDQIADERRWLWIANGKEMSLRSYDDALSGSAIIMSALRGTGTAISSITLGNATNNPSFAFAGTGTATFSGAVTINGISTFNGSGARIVFDTAAATDGRFEFEYNGTRTAYLNIASSSAFQIIGDTGVGITFGSGNSTRMTLNTSGHLVPTTTQASDLGGSGAVWRDIYSQRVLLETGSVTSPAFTFAAETNMGFYRNGTGILVAVINNGAALDIRRGDNGGVTIPDFSNGFFRAGYLGFPVSTKTASYTLVQNDAGKQILTDSQVTVPASVFSAGDAILITNNSGSSITIVQGASVTMYLAGTATTGNRTLAQRGATLIVCVASNTFHATNLGGLT